jgi:hypothetical protein
MQGFNSEISISFSILKLCEICWDLYTPIQILLTACHYLKNNGNWDVNGNYIEYRILFGKVSQGNNSPLKAFSWNVFQRT